MKGEVVAVVLLFLKANLCKAENVIVGSTKQLVCQIQNGNRWEKFTDGTRLWESIDNGGRYSGSNSGVLTITDFRIEDSGNYRCKVDGTVSIGDVIVLLPEVQSLIGSSVTLACTVSGTTIYWFVISKNSTRRLIDNDEYEGSRTVFLKIKSLTTHTAASYFCQPQEERKGPDITVSILVAGWSSWNAWSACSVACGTGQRQRYRTCSAENCAGSAIENENCIVDYGVDGGWSTWITSVSCTQSCGGGLQQRNRRCNNPPQANCGASCLGTDTDNILCSTSACPVNGGWSLWNSWGACSVTCETGQQSRSRTCDNPAPANNGVYCQGQGVEYNSCTLPTCLVNGGWSSWNSWGACNVICGTGQHSRRRSCNNPAPANDGADCPGEEYDYNLCTLPSCPVNGGWSSWNSWGACNVICGTGQHSRRRSCNNPAPANDGADCPGEEYDYNLCTLPSCPVNGGWSSWTSGICNATSCGTGQQSRRRYCNNPFKANGGADCQGEDYYVIACARSECAEKQSGNTPIVVGIVCGVLVIVILILILVIYAKRRWYNEKNEPDYETTDMTKVKGHIYGETHVNHIYQNDIQDAKKEVAGYVDEAHLVERYDVSDLTKRYRNKEYFLQSLRDEFKLLTDLTDDPNPLNSQYEIIVPGLRQDVNQFHLNSSTLDVLSHKNVSVLLEPPQKDMAEQFWTIVDNQCVENILLLTKGNEKISEFYPMLDDVLRINNFEIYLDSAERTNKNIMLLTINFQNKTTQSIRQIRMFKTNVSEYPTVQTLCLVIDKASEIRTAPVLIIKSKMADLSVCGVLTVCLNAVYAIKNGSPFSVLENAMVANKNNRRVFKNCDDYELCYKVLEHYLEAVHTYDFID